MSFPEDSQSRKASQSGSDCSGAHRSSLLTLRILKSGAQTILVTKREGFMLLHFLESLELPDARNADVHHRTLQFVLLFPLLSQDLSLLPLALLLRHLLRDRLVFTQLILSLLLQLFKGHYGPSLHLLNLHLSLPTVVIIGLLLFAILPIFLPPLISFVWKQSSELIFHLAPGVEHRYFLAINPEIWLIGLTESNSGIFGSVELNEGKILVFPGNFVFDHPDILDGAELFEELKEGVFREIDDDGSPEHDAAILRGLFSAVLGGSGMDWMVVAESATGGLLLLASVATIPPPEVLVLTLLAEPVVYQVEIYLLEGEVLRLEHPTPQPHLSLCVLHHLPRRLQRGVKNVSHPLPHLNLFGHACIRSHADVRKCSLDHCLTQIHLLNTYRLCLLGFVPWQERLRLRIIRVLLVSRSRTRSGSGVSLSRMGFARAVPSMTTHQQIMNKQSGILRNRTRELTDIKKRIDAKKHRFQIGKDDSISDNNTRTSDQLCSVRSMEVSGETQGTSSVELYEQAKAKLGKVGQIEKKIGELSKARLSCFKEAENKKYDETISKQASKGTELLVDTERIMKRLKKLRPANESQQKFNQNLEYALAGAIRETSRKLRQQQKDYFDTIRTYEHSTSNAAIVLTEEQKRMMRNDVQMEEIEEEKENDKVVQLVQSINRLSSIYKELNELVIEQGSLIDRIDVNIESTYEHVGKGVVHLERAEEAVSSALADKIIRGLVATIVLLALLLALKYANL